MGYLDDKIAKGIKQASKNSLTRGKQIPNATVKGGLKIAGASTEFAIQIGEDDNSPTKKSKTLDDAAKTARNKRSRENKKWKKQEAAKAKIDLLKKEAQVIEAQAAVLEEKKIDCSGRGTGEDYSRRSQQATPYET